MTTQKEWDDLIDRADFARDEAKYEQPVKPTGEDAWQSCDRRCKKCGEAGAVVYRVHEASDGGHEDSEFHCQSCDCTWWIDGIDS